MTDATVQQVQSLLGSGATVLNVGKHQGHCEIRGAARYRPHDLLTPDRLVIPIAPDKPVVLYDETGKSDQLRDVAAALERNGFTDVRLLTGGFAAWEAAGGETQEASFEQVVPPDQPSDVQALDRRV
jgi:rhodanese-related sulfurtransferase